MQMYNIHPNILEKKINAYIFYTPLFHTYDVNLY